MLTMHTRLISSTFGTMFCFIFFLRFACWGFVSANKIHSFFRLLKWSLSLGIVHTQWLRVITIVSSLCEGGIGQCFQAAQIFSLNTLFIDANTHSRAHTLAKNPLFWGEQWVFFSSAKTRLLLLTLWMWHSAADHKFVAFDLDSIIL